MAARPKIDYEDLYLSLKEKHLALSREVREKEDAWKVERVRLRKDADRGGGGASSAPQQQDTSTASAAPAAPAPAPASPNGGKSAPAAASAARPATAQSHYAHLRATPSAQRTNRPASALAVRAVNRMGAAAGTPSSAKRPGSGTPPAHPTPGGASAKRPPAAAAATPSAAPRPGSPQRPLPNAASTDAVSYSQVQLGALSHQLDSELSLARVQQQFLSPGTAVAAGFNNTASGTAGGGVPPVHFELVSLSPDSRTMGAGGGGGGAGSAGLASILQHPGARRPPENSMFWGVDSELPLDATITGRTLGEVNDRLRAQLRDCEVQLRRYSQEQALNRNVMDRQESQIQQLEHQILLVVQERDAMAQRTNATATSVQGLQQQLEAQLGQHEAVRGALEVQCREMRNKLLTEMEQREFLERELGKSRTDVQEELLRVAALQSRCAVAEAGLGSQRQANETLLVELHGLNEQLAAERRKTLETTRGLHLASHARQRAEELEAQNQGLKEQMQATQRENLALLEQMARCQDAALKTAAERVDAELAEAKAAAANWERVSLLQFRELDQNSRQRAHLRLELEAIKADRDEAALLLARSKSDAAYANAKLELCWPSHVRDTAGLTIEQIKAAFAKRMASPRRSGMAGAGSAAAAENSFSQLFAGFSPARGVEDAVSALGAAASPGSARHNESVHGPIREEDLVSELQAANAVLLAENESLRLQNSLLLARLEEAGLHYRREAQALETKVERVVKHEAASVAHASRQADRIGFLEALVRDLRGQVVDSSSFSVDELNSNETVLEVFLGKLLLDSATIAAASSSSSAMTGSGDPRAVPAVVAVVDFLIHESTVSEPVLPTLHATFDQTFAYRVNADAVLLHTIANGTVGVEIHEVHNGTQHHIVAKGEVGFRELVNVADAKRPTLRTHVNLYRVSQQQQTSISSNNNSAELYGRLEIVITSRVPFPSNFVRLCQEFRDSADFAAASSSSSSFRPNETVHAGRRTLFMPDPRDTSLSHSGVLGVVPGGLGGAESGAALHPNDVLALLLRCNQLTLRFHRVAIEFTETESPALSWWYSFGASSTEAWVLPPEDGAAAAGRYDAPIEVTNVHKFASSEELVAALRKTVAVVGFDEAEQDPSRQWGIASMALGALMAAPNQVLSMQLPVLSSTGRTRATLFAEASIAAVVQ